MGRAKSDFLTQGERLIMEVLWEHGALSAKGIHQKLNEAKEQSEHHAYTTIQTMCKILAQKDYAEFELKGRAFIYSAKISKNDARKTALKYMLQQFFGGSSLSLTQHLISEKEIDLDDLESIKQALEDKTQSE